MLRLCSALGSLFGCLFALSAYGLEPANPAANAKAHAILNYLAGLERRPDKRLLSGQFADFGRGANLRLFESIQEKTGKWPALMGVDYADFRKGGITTEGPNKAAIAYWNQGGLVTVSAHMYNPANPNGGGLRDKGVELAALLGAEGSASAGKDAGAPGETHQRWMRQLDEMAAGLQELKEAGVVVLWRPFHEMNGGWFWWGAKDPPSFIKVWRHMFEYYSKTKKLDNLLWVYGPNHGENTAAYYAGDQYVDIVGLDAYTDFIDPAHIRGYPEIATLPKPFGFTEYGPHGSSNPPGDYDYRRFIEGITNNFRRTVFFMSWNSKWSLNSNTNVTELLNHPWVVNRDELPPGLAGKSKE
jgi:mannan endo-1,4-beta-mannosidase